MIMSSSKKTGNEYSIELRIEGAQLIPSQVTALLGLAPSLTRESSLQDQVIGLWSFDGGDGTTEWNSIGEGFTYLLDILEPRVELIRTNFKNVDMYWWCALFQSTFDCTTDFELEVIVRLTKFGAPVSFSTYSRVSDA
jgi:hypothetical protein